MDRYRNPGRILKEDGRDRNFLAKKRPELWQPVASPDERGPNNRVLWGAKHARYDQGNTGTCVEHGFRHHIENGPIPQPLHIPHFDLYRMIVLRDEFPENDHETSAPVERLQYGSTVRAGAKVIRDLGYADGFFWAFEADTAIEWLRTRGGLVIGVNWYRGMFDADGKGYVNPTGSLDGGHCVYGFGADDDGDSWWLQSWPLPWGRGGKGTFKMSYATLDRLIKEDGEICMLKEVRR